MTDISGLGGSSALQDFEADLSGELAMAIQALEVRMAAGFEAAEEKLQRMSERASALVDAIVQHADLARAALDAGQADTEQVLIRVTDSRTRTDDAVRDADTKREQAMAVAGASAIAAEHAGDELQTTTHQSLGSLIDGITDAIETLKTGLAGGAERLEEVSTALEAFGDEGETQLKALCDQLGDLAELADSQLEQARTLLEAHAGDALDGLTADVEAALGVLSGAASNTSDTASALGSFAQDFAGEYGDEIEEVVAFIKQVVDLIEQIRPILELADQLS